MEGTVDTLSQPELASWGCCGKAPRTPLLRTEMYCLTIPEARRPFSLCHLQGKDCALPLPASDCPRSPQGMAAQLQSSHDALPVSPQSFLCACLSCPNSPLYKDTRRIRLQPTRVTLFKLDDFREDPISK